MRVGVLTGFILVMMLTGLLWAKGVKVAPRISDREIVERLTRLEEGQKALNKRIDGLEQSLNKRIDDVNKRIDGLERSLNKRIDDVNKRIDDLREEVNSRFNILQWMFGVFITVSLVILGFVLRMQWQMQRRQTSLETMLREQKEEIAFLKNLIEKLLPSRGVL